MSRFAKTVLSVFAFVAVDGQVNNVCKSFVDYATISHNDNCWYNPDVDSNPADMVIRNGYPFEAHMITTEDGYKLSLYRIPHNYTDTNRRRQPVFLQHGGASTCEIWIDKGSRRSLAYQLVDRGYDVWLGNFRGNPHALTHVYLSAQSREFWNFSFHEFGYYDLSAMLNFISKITSTRGDIIYIGHSMGTTAVFVYSILKKAEAEANLAGIISLGPHAYFLTTTPFVVLIPFADHINNLLASFNQYAVYQHTFIQRIIRFECNKFPITALCHFVISLMIGFNLDQVLPEEIPVVFSYLPVGISMKNVIHNVQQREAGGNFQYFDYGPAINKRLYGTDYPPSYDLSKISLPVHLLYGKNDLLTTEEAAIRIYENLNTTKSITHIAPDGSVDFNHLDFVYAKNITELLYPTLFEKIDTLTRRYYHYHF